MPFDITSWGTGSKVNETIPKIIENFRALRDDGITQLTVAQIDAALGYTPETQTGAQSKVDAHANRTDNPHDVTAAQVGTYTSSAIDAAIQAARQQADLYTDGAIASLVNGSPAMLDTLYELSNALGNDPNFAATVSNQIGLKAPLANPNFSGYVNAATGYKINGTDITTMFAPFTSPTFSNLVNVGQSASPYLQLTPTGWSNPFYLQAGIDAVGVSAGNYTTFLNPSGKGFSFSVGNSSKVAIEPTGCTTFKRSASTDPLYLSLQDETGVTKGFVGISRADGYGIAYGASANSLVIRSLSGIHFANSSATIGMTIADSNNVGIGVTSPQANLHTNGKTIFGIASGATSSLSSLQCTPYFDGTYLCFVFKDSNGVMRQGLLSTTAV